MEETLSLLVNPHCLQGKRVLSPQSGHEPSNLKIYTLEAAAHASLIQDPG
jgi:hypothetical protein